jgi:type IV secretion system protein TrbE
VDVRGAGLHFDTSRLPEGALKELAGFVVFDHVRHHILTLPRGASKVMLLDELRRILLIPGATEFVKELLAQMRKYRCVFIGAFQEPSQIDDIDPALTDLLLGQCKQYFLMRQNNADQVRRIARVIGLPGAAQRAIVQHPLVEHQSGREGVLLHLFLPGGPAPGAGRSGSRSTPPCSTSPSRRAPSSTGG